MSVKSYCEDHAKIFGTEFKPLINMKRDDIIQEFLFVSKIHRYEKLWIKGIRNLNGDPVGYVGWADAMKILPLYGIRKFHIRKHLRENGHYGHLLNAIKLENSIGK